MAKALAMFTDPSVCIGCRACQVACKQWNQLAWEEPHWTGSYQNHPHFTDKTWRLVRFTEKRDAKGDPKWLLMSDVCKHCLQAGCLEACPTGAIYRTEFGTVNVNQDICNGCRYCVSACPFGVISFNTGTGRVNKCTFFPLMMNGRNRSVTMARARILPRALRMVTISPFLIPFSAARSGLISMKWPVNSSESQGTWRDMPAAWCSVSR